MLTVVFTLQPRKNTKDESKYQIVMVCYWETIHSQEWLEPKQKNLHLPPRLRVSDHKKPQQGKNGDNKQPTTSIKPFQHTSRRKKALTLGRRKEKLSIPLEPHHKAQSSEFFLSFPPKNKELWIFLSFGQSCWNCIFKRPRCHFSRIGHKTEE